MAPARVTVRTITWRYTKRGRCRHGLINGRLTAACGHHVHDLRDWLGTGPGEKRTLLGLPACQKCQHFVDTSPDQIVEQL
jgi:hypothetical protein